MPSWILLLIKTYGGTKCNYANVQHYYVNMRFIHVNMQHKYVNMQLDNVTVLDNYVNMQLKLCCMTTYIIIFCRRLMFDPFMYVYMIKYQ